MLSLSQVLSFAATALYSGMWWLRWVRTGQNNKMWPMLGWFSGLICIGSVAGVVAWVANMQRNTLAQDSMSPGITRRQTYVLYAQNSRWLAALFAFYPVEFLCLIIPKLMLLGRLASNAMRCSRAQIPGVSSNGHGWCSARLLLSIYRAMAAAVLLCGIAVMCAYFVDVEYCARTAVTQDSAAAACDAQGGETISSLALYNNRSNVAAGTAFAAENGSEAIALLIVSFAYVVFVSISVTIFRRTERVAAHALESMSSHLHVSNLQSERMAAIVDDTMHAAAEQRRRLVSACVVVLLSFPIRASYAVMNAYSIDPQSNLACGSCDACQSDQWLIRVWISHTPEFQPIVVALSSPLPLSLSLWLITSAHARALAIAHDMQVSSIRPGALQVHAAP